MSKTPKSAKVNPQYKRKQSSRAELLKTCKQWGGELMDCRASLLKADEALRTELLTTAVLREEVKNLKAGLAEYKSACEAKQEQIEGAKAEIERLKSKCRLLYDEEFFQRKRNVELSGELEYAESLLRVQRDVLTNYNTRGNLIHWFGEFLLEKEPRA